MTQPTCILPDCDKPGRNALKPALCKMHYHRQYRHGSTETVQTNSDITASLGRRYRTVHAPHHPLAMRGGHVYEHRMVLFDAIGYGPHDCHWCGTEVQWTSKGDPVELQPDHLNNDGADNRIENLVASCRGCNTARGAQRRSDALRDAGWWSNHDTIARLATGGRTRRVDAA